MSETIRAGKECCKELADPRFTCASVDNLGRRMVQSSKPGRAGSAWLRMGGGSALSFVGQCLCLDQETGAES